MQLRDVIGPEVATIPPGTHLSEAAQKMNALNVNMLPVCDGRTLIGVLTARDLTVRATSAGCDPWTATVRDVMTREVIYARDDQDVHAAARLMERYRLTSLPVLNECGQLVGIVTWGNLRNALKARE
ncbi:MAG: Hypoxic response protein 1 [Verrucomicrobiae bacterium]|nr:Hypoxic response protein 1 [Verrucomicrobiae bacterium]